MESHDGIAYTDARAISNADESESQRLERIRLERREAERANAFKSLREQLRDNREREEAEWAERNNPFRPPPGATDDDVAATEELRKLDEMQRATQEAQIQNDKRAFELKQAEIRAKRREQAAATAAVAAAKAVTPMFAVSVANETAQTSASKSSELSTLPIQTIIHVKRKTDAIAAQEPSSKSQKVSSDLPSLAHEQTTMQSKSIASTAFAALSAYASSDDDDDDDVKAIDGDPTKDRG